MASARRIELHVFDSDPSMSPVILTLRPHTGRSLDVSKLLAAIQVSKDE